MGTSPGTSIGTTQGTSGQVYPGGDLGPLQVRARVLACFAADGLGDDGGEVINILIGRKS
jgi:hypothetical protein